MPEIYLSSGCNKQQLLSQIICSKELDIKVKMLASENKHKNK